MIRTAIMIVFTICMFVSAYERNKAFDSLEKEIARYVQLTGEKYGDELL